MSGYGLSSAKSAYVNTSRPKVYTMEQRRARKAKKMKLTIKQRIRNWLNSDSDMPEDVPQDIVVEGSRLDSEGLRLQIYKASGGYVVETRSYDRVKDRSHNSMFVITEDQDLGDQLGKIVMMEALRG
jgi:hypothetical protein